MIEIDFKVYKAITSFMNKARPNILWICSDQQRYDTLGCTGNPFVNTPNIDRLAQMGMLFERAYCQSPICTPSRASFLTGRYPRTTRCRQNNQSIPADEVLVTKLLAKAGYNCGLAGKLHLSPAYPWASNTSEKRIDDGYSDFHWSHQSTPDSPGNQYHQWLQEKGIKFQTTNYTQSGRVQTGMPIEFHQTTWCANKAIQFIEANAKYGTQPWLFSVNFFDPHAPFDPPASLLEHYLDRLEEIPLPEYQSSELVNKPLIQSRTHRGEDQREQTFAWDLITTEEHRVIKAAYWAMIDLIDIQVERLLDTLKKTGQAGNTIVIFMSDHGEMLGDHGIYFKGAFFYEQLVHVPLIMSYPDVILSNTRCNALIELVDIAPTLLDAIGLDSYAGMQGKSFWSLLTGKTEPTHHRDDVYCENYNASTKHHPAIIYGTMLRTERYKIVRIHGMSVGELYDLQLDPDETRNRWDDPNYINIKVEMLIKLMDRMAWTSDPLPLRDKRGDTFNYLTSIDNQISTIDGEI